MTVVGLSTAQPLTPPPPKQNQIRLLACFNRRQPFLLTSLIFILSTIDISILFTLDGSLVLASKVTQTSTLKSPPETRIWPASPSWADESKPFSANACFTMPGPNPAPPVR